MSSNVCHACGLPCADEQILCGRCALPSWPGEEALQELFPDLRELALLDGSASEAVYSARQDRLRRPVSLIVRLMAAASLEHQDRFRQWACLHHPYIPTVIDYGLRGGYPFLITERLPDRHLSDAVHDDKWTTDSIGRLLVALAEGLEHAHQMGVVHGNLDLEHVLLQEHGHPLVIGWLVSSGPSEQADPSKDLTALQDLAKVLASQLPAKAADAIVRSCAPGITTLHAFRGALSGGAPAGLRKWLGG